MTEGERRRQDDSFLRKLTAVSVGALIANVFAWIFMLGFGYKQLSDADSRSQRNERSIIVLRSELATMQHKTLERLINIEANTSHMAEILNDMRSHQHTEKGDVIYNPRNER